ncbi:hypothetical protein [Nocardia sp. A7]|uniref:hypothetical protein n=1 Tax=Nocardia sp. A7 TaxID=2789274 RepID=UPI00397804E4
MTEPAPTYDAGGVLPRGAWVPYRSDWVAHGVRWTDETGAVRVHQTHTAAIAPPLASMLRAIQADRGAVPDAGVITRQMSGDQPIGEWVAAGPSTGPTA